MKRTKKPSSPSARCNGRHTKHAWVQEVRHKTHVIFQCDHCSGRMWVNNVGMFGSGESVINRCPMPETIRQIKANPNLY